MTDLAGLLAKTFIARKDVKAVQNKSGEYMPVQHCVKCGRGFCSHEDEKVRDGWKRADIEDHLAGRATYGHYLLNIDDTCKFFAFDIDLEQEGVYPKDMENPSEILEFEPRKAWVDRGHPARTWMKFQLHTAAHALLKAVRTELEVPALCAYTGSKGLHVYGLTGPMSAADIREGAQIVIDSLADTHMGALEATRGSNFFKFENQDPFEGQPNIQIELFPKQDNLDGKDLGNLMRLPLGRNLKNAGDPTFFVDMTSALTEIKPIDPVYALTDGLNNPWRRQGE